MKILFVTSEVYPLIKTGGLADVSGSLPIALEALGHDVRILMPAYPSAIVAGGFKTLKQLGGTSSTAIVKGILPGSKVPVWAIADERYFSRNGNPYLGADGAPWPDNAERFALLCRVGVEIAMNRLGLDWKPDIVHCNDWQTGLIPALLTEEPLRPASVFTIHNLAYQGLFPRFTFDSLRLPSRFWTPNGLEFYNQLSFIKGGLVFADRITTVSPTYAEEIQTPSFGCGLDGLMSFRKHRLSGILNGIDCEAWNPASDTYLPSHFDSKTISKRLKLKTLLQKEFELEEDPNIPVLAWVGRLVEQKGIDLLIELLPQLMALPIQIAMIGSGDIRYERALQQWGKLFPQRLVIRLGYNESIAHLLEAGSDIFLMPSKFEPCGLNQMYSQRYGALPLVRKAGGLADTVVDANATTIKNGTASGIVFEEASPDSFMEAIQRSLALYQTKSDWAKVQSTGMNKDFSWEISARQYAGTYEQAIADISSNEKSFI